MGPADCRSASTRVLVWDTSFELVSRIEAISHSRKIVCSAALIAASLAMAAAPGSAAGSPTVPVRARVSQAGRRLLVSLRTSRPVALAGLTRLPAGGGSSSLCLELRDSGGAGERRLCIGGPNKASRHAGLELLDAAGEVTSKETVPARLKRPQPDKLVLALLPSDAGLTPQRYRWRVTSTRGSCRAKRPDTCETSLPAGGTRLFRLRPVRRGRLHRRQRRARHQRPARAQRRRPHLRRRSQRIHAGLPPGAARKARPRRPSSRSARRCRAAKRRCARSCAKAMRSATTRCTTSNSPATAQIARRRRRWIESYTHFRPCLFRPPGGAVDSSVIGDRRRASGMRTITWDVDPADWSTPGTQRDLQPRRRRRPARLDHPHARRRRPARRDPGGAAAGSSTPCAPAATASRPSPTCSASG